MEIVVSNHNSKPLYEQIALQIKAAIMSGDLKAGTYSVHEVISKIASD